METAVNTKDATVDALVGLGGKMLSSRVLLDSGADFTCVKNEAIVKLIESGVDLVIQPVRDPSFAGVAIIMLPWQ